MTAQSDNKSLIRRLTLYFGLVYLMQGFAQDSGIVQQPLRNYFLHGLGWPVDRMSVFLSVLIIPWLVKPVYGLISDLIPIRRRHRTPYLLLMTALASLTFFIAAGMRDPQAIVYTLLLSAIGVAFTDVVSDALMVGEGQRLNMVQRFQGVQWTWINVAGVAAAVLGGFLAGKLGPENGLRAAMILSAIAPLALLVATVVLIREEPAPARRSLRETVEPLLEGFRTRDLWLAGLFILLWNCTPSFGDPLYAHMSDRLGFTQGFIGNLLAVGSLGAALGAWMYESFLSRRFPLKSLVVWSIPAGALSNLAYLGMTDGVSAGVIAFVTGATGMVFMLVMLGIAGEACPARGAGFWFAALMAVSNGSTRISVVAGSYLYERVLEKNFAPLVWISAGTTLLLFILVPLVGRIVRDGKSLDGQVDST